MQAEAKRKNKPQDKVVKLKKKNSGNPVALSSYNPDDIIFALDIGTRTVIGIVGIHCNGKFHVISSEIIEHKSRAMLDGQIHDVSQVTEAAGEVKRRLEKKTGLKLSKVAIAAAGRVLKTCEVHIEKDIDPGCEINQDIVSSLEIEGIQKAQLKLDEDTVKDDKTQFYCVGYSVINYYLNEYVISKLVGHKGKKIGADILATFLPHVVVDSLYTVMDRLGLEVVSLTLEPIAAINVTIPEDLRLLNLALVDIGAGTSDIAITRDGSVVAYAMVPIAGDEITEKLAQHYLVDFNTAEKIKIGLSSGEDSVSFTDILKKKQNVKVGEALEIIKPTVEILAATISKKILEYNHKSPNAVFLIGGGSQVPGLTDMISENLNLPKDRVVVRGRDVVQNIKFSGKKLSGPESITPLGIAVTAQMQKGRDFLSVTVNERKIRLFNSKKLNVADALILVGFNPEQLIGRTGKSLSFTLNGERKTIRGGFGKSAEIYVNDIPANLETMLKVGDKITVIPAENGRDASAKVSDIIKEIKAGTVLFNGKRVAIGTRIYINGHPAQSGSLISEGDVIKVDEILTLNDLMRQEETDFADYDIYVNGEAVDGGYALLNSDIITCEPKKRVEENHVGNPGFPDNVQEIEIRQESEAKEIINTPEESYTTGFPVESITGCIKIEVNGSRVILPGNKTHYIFVDIFNFINFDLSKPKGSIVLKLNGRPASFTDEIRNGDIVEIYWDDVFNKNL